MVFLRNMLFISICFGVVWITVAGFSQFNLPGINFADPEIQRFTALLNQHQFKLADSTEFLHRLGLFKNAKAKLTEFHNKFKHANFTLNKFSLLSDDEIKHYLSGHPAPLDGSVERVKRSVFNGVIDTSIPGTFDFRDSGKVSPVKDQGQCGSCYAFTTNAAIESQYLLRQNSLLDLSEQSIVSCETNSYQCSGGYIGYSFNYARDNGIPLESCYPYTAQNGTCGHGCDSQRYKIAGYRYFGNDEAIFAQHLYNYGPLTMFLNIPQAFMSYNSGVLDLPAAECYQQNLGGHFLLIVGYTPEYWIAKNSWGTNWGENGFVKFKRGQNFCNMTTQVVTPYL